MSMTFKRHYPLLILLAFVTISLVLGLGDQHIVAYSIPDNETNIHLAQTGISNALATFGMH
jgi:hypothetical protein